MNASFNNVVIYNGYPLSVVVAVTFHSLILALLLYLQSNRSPDVLELIQPTVVKALLVQENPQVTNERARLERQQQQRRIRQQEDAQRAAEVERHQEQAQAEARAQEERQQRERAALRARQEQERLTAEQRQREKERREEEQRRQRELAEAQRQQEIRDRELQRQQDAADAESATSEFEMIQSGTALIQQVVQENWSRPPSARNGMRAILQIRMLPTGELINATITQSSGDPAFDRSAENAVYRAAPFRELQNLPINVFNANFRALSLIFEPEDLLN